jgi:hypothetical protein
MSHLPKFRTHQLHRFFMHSVITVGAWLWRVIWWVWSTIIVGSLLVGALNSVITTGPSGLTDPRKWFVVHALLSKPSQAVIVIVVALIITLGAYLAHRSQQKSILEGNAPPALSQSSQNRQRMLAKVRAFWISEVLVKSLDGVPKIELRLHKQLSAVANPWKSVLQQPDDPARLTVSGIDILQIFNKAGGELLILGEPGVGKTTLLLELTRDLLDLAEEHESFPIPVVLNLSSWSLKRQPIIDWLVEELNTKYQVPHVLGQSWVIADQLALLLDGLDEVAPEIRPACIKEINDFRKEHGLVPIAIASRGADYLEQQQQLLLHSAITVQPLTAKQVDDYLTSAGDPLATMRKALDEDPSLRELAATPLMLSVLVKASQVIAVGDLPTASSQAALRQKVFQTYIHSMLQRRSPNKQYSSPQMMRWLTWLAQQMMQHGQVEFYLERIQPDWFSQDWSNRFKLIVRSGIGLICGLICLFLGGLAILNLKFGVAFGLLFGLVFAVTSWVNSYITPAEVISWSLVTMWRQGVKVELRSTVVRILPVGLICAFLSGFFLLLLSGGVLQRSTAHLSPLRTTLEIGLLCGMLGFLLAWLFDGFASNSLVDIANESILFAPQHSLWRTLKNSVPAGFLFGLVSGLVFGLLFGYLIGPVYGLLAGLLFCIANGLLFGLINQVKREMNFTEVLSRFRIHLWQKRVKTEFRNVLGIGLGMWLIIYILQTIGGVVSTLYAALFAMGVIRLLMGIISGLSSDMLNEQVFVAPNQGIRNSARNSAFVGLIFGTIGGLLFGLIFALIYALQGTLSLEWFYIWLFIVIGGVVSGLAVGLPNGGIACIQHVILRFFLCSFGKTPWNYPRFLDHAADRVLLRKIGGGYMFIHQSLLEHFASLDAASAHHDAAETILD